MLAMCGMDLKVRSHYTLATYIKKWLNSNFCIFRCRIGHIQGSWAIAMLTNLLPLSQSKESSRHALHEWIRVLGGCCSTGLHFRRSAYTRLFRAPLENLFDTINRTNDCGVILIFSERNSVRFLIWCQKMSTHFNLTFFYVQKRKNNSKRYHFSSQ